MTRETLYVIACGVLFVLWAVSTILLILWCRKNKQQKDHINELWERRREIEENNFRLSAQLDDKARTIKKQAEIIADLMNKNAEMRRSNLFLADQIREECEAEKIKMMEEYEAKLKDAWAQLEALEKEYNDFQEACKLGEYMISQAEGERIDLERRVKILTSENNRLKEELKGYQTQD